MVSMMAKQSIVALVLSLRCFLFLLPNYINVYSNIMQYFSHLDKKEVLQLEYSPPSLSVGGKIIKGLMPDILTLLNGSYLKSSLGLDPKHGVVF